MSSFDPTQLASTAHLDGTDWVVNARKWFITGAEGAGFVNLHERKFKVPLGPWPRDTLLKETGMMNLVQQLEEIEVRGLPLG